MNKRIVPTELMDDSNMCLIHPFQKYIYDMCPQCHGEGGFPQGEYVSRFILETNQYVPGWNVIDTAFAGDNVGHFLNRGDALHYIEQCNELHARNTSEGMQPVPIENLGD